MAGKTTEATVTKVEVGESSARQLREAVETRQQAQVVFEQATQRIESIRTAWLEAKGLPVDWQFTVEEGRFWLVAPEKEVAEKSQRNEDASA